MGQCMSKGDISFVSPQETEQDFMTNMKLSQSRTGMDQFTAVSPVTDVQKIPSSFGRDPEAKATIPGVTGTSSSLNMSAVSAPSAIDNSRLTTIYHVPDERFKTIQDVLDSRHIRHLSKLDEGGFAKVYLALLEDRKVACKVIDLGAAFSTWSGGPSPERNNKLTDVKNELFVLQKIKHPHIIRLHVHFIINDMLYIYMHYANAGNLFQFMQLHGPMAEQKTRRPFAQIVSGVAFMHAKCIAHRDLKLSNILLNAGEHGQLQILIADFGLSRVVYRARTGVLLCKSYCGTPNYMAPELKRRKRYNAFAIDIYALGVMLFLLINCSYPFDVKDDTKALVAMERSEPALIWNGAVKPSDQLLGLLNWMLQPNVSRRISMPELLKADWYRAEMAELKACLPPMEDFDKLQLTQTSTLRRLSSPTDDVRLEQQQISGRASGPNRKPPASPAFSSFSTRPEAKQKKKESRDRVEALNDRRGQRQRSKDRIPSRSHQDRNANNEKSTERSKSTDKIKKKKRNSKDLSGAKLPAAASGSQTKQPSTRPHAGMDTNLGKNR